MTLPVRHLVTNLIIALVLIGSVEGASYLYVRRQAAATAQSTEAYSPPQLTQRSLATNRLYLMQMPWTSGEFNVDDNGFRTTAGARDIFASYKPTDFNIMTFGGSMTFGIGVKDRETWSQQLQQTLSRQVAVYNVGQGGASSFDEMYMLVQMLSSGRIPQIAIFMDGGNEECPEPKDRSAIVRKMTEVGPLNWLLAKSSTVALIKRRLPAPEVDAKPVDLAVCAEAYAKRADLVQRLLATFGSRAYFVFHPTGETIPNFATYRFPTYGNPSKDMSDFRHRLYDTYIERVRRDGSDRVVDLRRSLDTAASDGKPVFVDLQHPAALGHAIIADALARELNKRDPSLREIPQ